MSACVVESWRVSQAPPSCVVVEIVNLSNPFPKESLHERTLTRPSDRASRFVRDALLAPDQVDDIVLTPKDAEEAAKKADRPLHAHGDTGHGDFGHADR